MKALQLCASPACSFTTDRASLSSRNPTNLEFPFRCNKARARFIRLSAAGSSSAIRLNDATQGPAATNLRMVWPSPLRYALETEWEKL
jgi:hypothetical protein